MKTPIKRTPSQNGFARARSRHLIALALSLLALPGALSAQTLLHRYSFVSDASDSVGTANGTLVAGNNPASISNGLMLPGTGTSGTPSGYVSLPNGIVQGDTSVTVECWVTQNAANTWAEIWSFGVAGGAVNFGLIAHPGNNGGNIEVAFTPNGGEQDLQTLATFPNGTEQYLAVTYNNTNLTGNIYGNGLLDATRTFPGTNYSPGNFGSTSDDNIGRDPFGGDQMFNGTVYELRIWNGALSQRQISASALLGPSVLVTNLNATAVSVTAGGSLVFTGTEQAAVTVELPQTGSTNLAATLDATNWTSANTNILKVNSNGLITAVSFGTTTVSATVSGITATSGSITVTPQTLMHRYSFVSDATDSVGGANGTIVPPVATNATATATIANGLSLPGSTGGTVAGYVSLPAGIVQGDSSVTVECWVTQNAPRTWAELWDFGVLGGANTTNLALIPVSPTPNMKAAFQPNNGEDDIVTAAMPSASEQYVVVTYNNSTLVGDLYTNGIIGGTFNFPNISYSPGSYGPGGTSYDVLGADRYGDAQFDGTLYELRIWNGAVSPLYVAVSAAAGPSVVVANLTPTSLAINITNASILGAQTEQASVTGNFADASGVTVTGAATNWISSNTNILTVSSSGLITGVSGGNATVSATVGGVTATSAMITVQLTVPVITQQPAPLNLVVGDTATFTVAALGGQLTYQWKDGATPILGATTPTLTLTNLSLSQSGNYSVLVTNALGSTNSISVALTVNSTILKHRYSFVSDASDSIGGANGTLIAGNNPATISDGLMLPGTGTSGTPSGYVSLPNGIVQGDNSVTVECWVTQNQANTWAEIWSFAVNGGSVNFALIPYPAAGHNNQDMLVAFTPNGGERDLLTPTSFPNGSQQYVVVTYNNANLTGNLYLNGALDGSIVLPSSAYSPGNYGSTSFDTFGSDPFGGDNQFNGTLSEVRIWDGVVSPLYIAVSEAAGPGTLVTNLTPTSVTITVTNTTLEGLQTEQASATADFTGVSGVTVTDAVTNWISSNPSVLTVDSNGVITAVGAGSATISGTLAGTTGTSASITVPADAPTITVEPEATETLLVGGTLHATVVNEGVGPFTYKWFFNSSPTPISGATTSTLTIPAVQMANAGNYYCEIINAYGSTNSTALDLTVVSPTTYQADLLALGPLAYWPLNETAGSIAYDLAGGYNGTYIGGVSLASAGPTNSEFSSPSYSANFDGSSGYVDIPEGPFNITNAISIAIWVNANPNMAIPGFSDFIGHGDQSWRMTISGSPGIPGANDGGPPADANGSTSILDANWHLVVYTYDGTLTGENGLLYVDGALVGGNAIATVPAGDNLDVWIGGAPDYGVAFGVARLFAGSLADAAVFNYALSASQVQGLYNGQVSLTIKPSGTSVIISWPSGTLLQAPSLTGPWTTNNAAVSPYTVPATSGNQFFRVLISQ